MALRPMPPQAGQPPANPHEHFAKFVNKHSYVPMWLHPHVAAGVIRHFGRDGSALVHPHPATTGNGGTPRGMLSGGVVPVPPTFDAGLATAAQPPIGRSPPGVMPPGVSRPAPTPRGMPAVPPRPGMPAAAAAPYGGSPLAGIPPSSAAAIAGKSIFGGGNGGAGGPFQINPVFGQEGLALDARGGGKVPGKPIPPSAPGHDKVHAMLDAGEAVFNQRQLAGIKIKPGKGHLVRSDQRAAMKKASGQKRK